MSRRLRSFPTWALGLVSCGLAASGWVAATVIDGTVVERIAIGFAGTAAAVGFVGLAIATEIARSTALASLEATEAAEALMADLAAESDARLRRIEALIEQIARTADAEQKAALTASDRQTPDAVGALRRLIEGHRRSV